MRRALLSSLLLPVLLPLVACDGTSSTGGGGGAGGTGASGGAGGSGAQGGQGGDTIPPPPPPPVCTPPVALVDTSASTNVVGDGTPASCTEAALVGAIGTGGLVRFDCGPDPVTITVTSTLVVGVDTVIDGGGTVTLSGGGTTRILTLDTNDDFEALSPVLTLERITLKDGHATGTQTPLGSDLDGGGAAVYYVGGEVIAIDSTFVDNVAAVEGPDVAGGAVYAIGRGGFTAVGCSFAGNRASNGGAIGILGGPLTVVNSVLDGNQATGHGANYIDQNGQQQGRGGNGGAMSMDGQGQELLVCGAQIRNNVARAFGGAIMRTSYESEPSVIQRSWFDANQVLEDPDPMISTGAGAIYLQGSTVTMDAVTVSNNQARGSAGVWILAHGAVPAVANLTNVTLAHNDAYVKDPFTDTSLGGGLNIGDLTTGTLQNCTIFDNGAQFGSGILRSSPLSIRNTIIANRALNLWTPLNCTGTNFADPPAQGSANLQWAWVDGMAVPTGPQQDMDCVAGIVRADPLLGALEDGDPVGVVKPLAGSPALGAGTQCPSTDALGNARPADGCTLGAYQAP